MNDINQGFINHKHNGVYLKFPNGNAISTIWGRGSYSQNHDYTTGSVIKDFEMLIEEGSPTAEIMIDTDNAELRKKIFRKFGVSLDNGVIGWVSIEDWLWVLNRLEKNK
uniref:Uncharacterized protein n=1 Tax=viral metagenome TaxID=1070528 RepID=A0A6M3LW91_9ZZZZ